MTIAVWAFVAATLEVLHPFILGVKWKQSGINLVLGLGKMFGIHFVKNALIATLVGGLPLLLLYLADIQCIKKCGCFSSPFAFILKSLLAAAVILILLVTAGNFISLISFRYFHSYVKAFISIYIGVTAGLYVVKGQFSKTS